jgi:hypothetical protein
MSTQDEQHQEEHPQPFQRARERTPRGDEKTKGPEMAAVEEAQRMKMMTGTSFEAAMLRLVGDLMKGGLADQIVPVFESVVMVCSRVHDALDAVCGIPEALYDIKRVLAKQEHLLSDLCPVVNSHARGEAGDDYGCDEELPEVVHADTPEEALE